MLPYAFGTHSGWVEACHDLGTTVLAPRTGHWVEQQPMLTFGWPAGEDPDEGQVSSAVQLAFWDRPRWPPTPTAAPRSRLPSARATSSCMPPCSTQSVPAPAAPSPALHPRTTARARPAAARDAATPAPAVVAS